MGERIDEKCWVHIIKYADDRNSTLEVDIHITTQINLKIQYLEKSENKNEINNIVSAV